MDLDDIIQKSKKIRIYPTKKQKQIFNRWFGTERFVYNCTVEYLRQKGTKADWKGIKTEALKVLDWAVDTPYQVKSIAIRDACNAVKNAKKKFKKTGEYQEVGFKSRKHVKQSCFIPKSAITDEGIYKNLTEKLKITEQLPSIINDSRLVYENEKWFLCLSTEDTTKMTETQGRVVALDPGIRAFISFFSPNSCGKIGNGDFGRIVRLCKFMDDLISKRDASKNKEKKQMFKSAIAKIRWKIKNLISELHHKTAKFLINDFDIILLPTFETSDMVLKCKRKIKSKTARAMLTFSFYKFSRFLKHKAFEFGKIVIDVTEEYTSKTVSWTGEIIENLGGRKEIKSKSTGWVMDRDINGARGIFLKALVDSPIIRNNNNNNNNNALVSSGNTW